MQYLKIIMNQAEKERKRHEQKKKRGNFKFSRCSFLH